MTPTAQQTTDIVDKVRKRLAEGEREGIHLKVVMSKIERALRAQGDDQVLLVPALQD